MSRKAYDRKPFSPSEDQFIRENYQSMSFGVLSSHLHRTYDSVKARCRLLGIKPIHAEHKGGRPQAWHGCKETCPDFCPYKECRKP